MDSLLAGSGYGQERVSKKHMSMKAQFKMMHRKMGQETGSKT